MKEELVLPVAAHLGKTCSFGHGVKKVRRSCPRHIRREAGNCATESYGRPLRLRSQMQVRQVI